jgi:hypothetical protein
MEGRLKGRPLTEYILDGTRSRFSEVLTAWFATSEWFEAFADHYKGKIRKKARTAKTDDDLEDLQFELQAPFLLLSDSRFTVEYEKYGAGPDFTATFEGRLNFNVEVKRIRESKEGALFDKCMDDITRRIEAIPSKLAFWLDAPELESNLDLSGRLQRSKEAIVSFVADRIHSEEEQITPDSPREYPIPGFEGELVLELTKPVNKRDPGTSYHGGTKPVFYTQKEHRKFGDVILESLRQLKPGVINVLFIGSNSSTHEDRDMRMAVDSINRNLRRREENFFSRLGFTDRPDFIRQSRKLSGILFRSIWISSSAQDRDRNFLWLNAGANHPIPEEICKYLREMTGRNRPFVNEELSS